MGGGGRIIAPSERNNANSGDVCVQYLHGGHNAAAEHELEAADVALGSIAHEHLVGLDQALVQLLRDLRTEVGLSERRPVPCLRPTHTDPTRAKARNNSNAMACLGREGRG